MRKTAYGRNVKKKAVRSNSVRSSSARNGSVRSSSTRNGSVRKSSSGRKKTNISTYDGTLLFIRIMFGLLIVMLVVLVGAMILTSTDGITFSSQSIKYTASSMDERKYLWDVLMKHFDDNETAVLGLMCNIHEESNFQSYNLEDHNNTIWDISDEDYTYMLNKGSISKKDFLEARFDGNSSGYCNSYGQWHNLNGGYGYCQYTAYEKKKALYDFATEWFDKGGEGEGLSFDIADPKMQASFIVYLLDNDLSDIDYQMRTAESIEDAVYIWVSEYECPEGEYHSVALSRAECAEEIREYCTSEENTDGDAQNY